MQAADDAAGAWIRKARSPQETDAPLNGIIGGKGEMMTSKAPGGFSSLHDPYWTAEEYVRFADHRSPAVRLWSLERLEDLGLEIPEGILRRRLRDPEEFVAIQAAVLAGRLGMTSLTDALLARLQQAEDAVGAALPHPEAQAAVVERLVAAAPTEAWERVCVETLERRAAQAPMAASLLGAWRSAGAIPALVGALGAGEDPELPAAAEEALVNVGEPAVGAVLQALASAEDPAVLEGCLDVCVRLPSGRAVAAIGRRFEGLFILVPQALLHAVDRIGAREFVEPLRAEVRESELQAEDTFLFLCDLHGVADPRLSAIRER